MLQYPEIPWPLQLKYLILYQAALVCGLWLRADSRLTFALMAVGPLFVLISRLPMNWFPRWLRQFAQMGVLAFTVYWLQGRLMEIPFDTCALEAAVLLMPALFLGGNRREHALLWLVCLVLAGYGGMFPARSVFLPAFLAVALVSLLILYTTRTTLLLAIGRKQRQIPPSQARYTGNWGYRTAHLLLALILAYLMAQHISLREKLRTPGLIPVSFRSDQPQEFPELWEEWAAPSRHLLRSASGRQTADGKQPHLLDHNSKQTIRSEEIGRDGEDGSGSGMGEDLVFRAFTPAKLYWVMQLYDTFDGTTWSRSKAMLRGTNALDTYKPDFCSEVVQNISIEKAVSRYLPFAYKPVQMLWQENESPAAGLPISPMGQIRRQDNASFQLRNEALPPLPWRYSVVSLVPDVPDPNRPRPWREPVRNYGWNYRQLPPNKLSSRMQNLARRLTAGADTPHAKALALRDYLRQNYAYSLTPPETPEGKETTDYFLFESRLGYCQHFAQALVLLARMAGLPARLATGYSPGNYNLLANCFEVYEYHGHAWTQIFIEPFGWLTFDGTPPGALRLDRDEPKLLRRLLDPFGEKWRLQTPELSARTPTPSQPTKFDEQGRPTVTRRTQKPRAAAADSRTWREKIHEKAMLDNATTAPNQRQLAIAALQLMKEQSQGSLREFARQAGDQFRGVGNWLGTLFQRLWQWLRQRTPLQLAVVLSALAGAISLVVLRHRLRATFRWYWHYWRCQRAWRRLQGGEDNPQRRIEGCLAIINRLLELAGMHRHPGEDLQEHANGLRPRFPQLADSYNLIAGAALSLWYSPRPPDLPLAAAVLRATADFRREIAPRLRPRRNYGFAEAGRPPANPRSSAHEH